jgi:hypothetical protein
LSGVWDRALTKWATIQLDAEMAGREPHALGQHAAALRAAGAVEPDDPERCRYKRSANPRLLQSPRRTPRAGAGASATEACRKSTKMNVRLYRLREGAMRMIETVLEN